MSKEIQSIQHLKTQREDYSNLVDQRLDFVGSLGREKLKNADTSAAASILRTRKRVNQVIGGFKGKIEEIDKELKPYENALRYVELTKLGINEIRQLKTEGYLSENDQLNPEVQEHLTEFEELERQKESDQIFRSWLDKIREDEAVKEESKEPEAVDSEQAPQTPTDTNRDEEKEPEVFMLHNGEVIAGQVGMLLYYASKGSKDNRYPIKELIQKILPGIDYKIARQGQFPNIVRQAKRQVQGKGIELIGAPGKIGGYYLEAMDLPSKSSEAEASTNPTEINISPTNEVPIQEPHDLAVTGGAEIVTENGSSPVETKKPLTRVEAFVQNLDGEAKDLLSRVTKSADFTNAKQKASEALKQKKLTIDEIKGKVSGYLFETLAYLHLYDDLASKGKFLLSPQQTFKLLTLLYPDKEEIYNTIGLQYGIENITVPDGIVIDNINTNSPVILGVTEYSLAINNDRGFKENFATMPYFDVSNLIKISSLTKDELHPISIYLKKILPNNGSGQIPVNEKGLRQLVGLPDNLKFPIKDGRVSIKNIPVSSLIFGEYINALMSDVEKVSQEQNATVAVSPEIFQDTSSIEMPEFAGLSRAEIALIAERLDSNRDDLERLGIEVINRRIVFEIINELTGGQRMKDIDKMTEEERDQFVNNCRADAFIKLKKMVKGPKFDEFMDSLPEKYSGVRVLLKNAFDINEALEKAGQEGITIIADDPEQLKMIVMPQRKIVSSGDEADLNPTETLSTKTENPVGSVEDRVPIFSAPAKVVDSGSKDQKISKGEKENNIEEDLTRLLENIIEEIGHRSLNPVVTGNTFTSLRGGTIHKALTGKWIPKKTEGRKGGDLMFDPSDIAIMMYIENNDIQTPNLRKEVSKIAKQAYQKIMKGRNSR